MRLALLKEHFAFLTDCHWPFGDAGSANSRTTLLKSRLREQRYTAVTLRREADTPPSSSWRRARWRQRRQRASFWPPSASSAVSCFSIVHCNPEGMSMPCCATFFIMPAGSHDAHGFIYDDSSRCPPPFDDYGIAHRPTPFAYIGRMARQSSISASSTIVNAANGA